MRYIILILLIACTSVVWAQTTNISGVINTYTKMTGINGDTIKVTSASGFSAGDKVLIIQMQGATINESNSNQFGNVASLKNAGKYEYTRICEVVNNRLIVTGINRKYSVNGSTQIIRVPEYANAVVTSALQAEPWDGETGGVIAFECSGTLTLNSDIDAMGMGFRGGETTLSTYNCQFFFNVNQYFYNISTGEGAKKGEGIAKYISGKTGGRGPQANGGGGSNDHNAGGGGGSNAAAGGDGGQRIAPTAFSCSGPNPGLGGNTLSYSNNANRIYLGGGGGAGHENNPNTGTAGSNGGGIVMIKANIIVGNGATINASADQVVGNSADGAGGGGAGGTVLLEVDSYSGTLNMNIAGADGGDVANVGNNCNGPGGGGSGGVIWVIQASLPANINVTNDGGLAGTTLATGQSNCNVGSTNSASNGSNGITRTNLELQQTNCNESIPFQSVNDTICGEDSLFLAGAWQTMSGIYIDTISLGCCDSVVETTLTVLPEKTGIYTDTICEGDSVIVNGTVYSNETSNAKEVFTNIGPYGCDSTVIVNIALRSVQASYSVLDTSNEFRVLIADQDSAQYQWILCPEATPIDGETAHTYQVFETQNIALVVTKNGCSDTSDCQLLEVLGVQTIEPKHNLSLYPNPSGGRVTIVSENSIIDHLEVYDVDGKMLDQLAINSSQLDFELPNYPGVYIVRVYSGTDVINLRAIKLQL